MEPKLHDHGDELILPGVVIWDGMAAQPPTNHTRKPTDENPMAIDENPMAIDECVLYIRFRPKNR
jgi:hypothetical protein